MLAEPAVALGQIEFVGKGSAVFRRAVLGGAKLHLGVFVVGHEVARIERAVRLVAVGIDRDVGEIVRIERLVVDGEIAAQLQEEAVGEFLLGEELGPPAVLLARWSVPRAAVEIGALAQAERGPRVL